MTSIMIAANPIQPAIGALTAIPCLPFGMRTSRRFLPATLMLPRRPDEPILPTLFRPMVPSRLPILAAMRFVSRWMERLWSDAEAAYRAEILASWHNVAALVLGHQPFSLTNVSARGPIGNPLALHTDPPSAPESWQHVHVLSLEALRDLFVAHGFGIEGVWAAGYHPLPGR